jgi:membrane-bound serine protease (ClpP class)
MFLVSLVIRARSNKAVMSEGGLLNEIGEARTALEPAGKVFVHGEYWDAISTAPVSAGGHVRVVAVDGMKIRVEPVSHS